MSRTYYGSGYVQLTWWYHYVVAGAVLGRGLQFLFDPDLVLDPDVAYQIMATGMREGVIFANGHRFADYFNAATTDYIAARHMVNGHDQAQTIASIAEAIEACLLDSVSA